MRKKETVCSGDRLLSCLSYLTAGWGGVIVLFFLYIQKKNASPFLRFNAFQSIFISLLYFVLSLSLGLLAGLLKYIPFLNYAAAQIIFLFNRPLIFNWSLVQSFMLGIVLYTSVLSLFGKYPRIYKISSIVDYNAK